VTDPSRFTVGVAIRAIKAEPRWWLESAVRLAEAGYDGIWSWDHVMGRLDLTDPVVECWTMLAMTAARNVTATFSTSGGTGGTCANPITFTGNTGNFNTTGAACYRTNATINGWGCSNFDGRTVTVGGQARTCGQLPLTRSADGYYYFAVTAGTYPWASLYYW